MKEQYVGDINDYRKYALLRALTGDREIKIGICWMLTPPDGSADGNKTAYLERPGKWRQFDPQLFDLLITVSREGGHERLIHLEQSEVVPRAEYFNQVVPDPAAARAAYFEAAFASLRNADLVFFDPDNGIDVPSKPKGRKGSSKYVYRDEVRQAFDRGHSILIYQHFPHVDRHEFITRIGRDLIVLTGGSCAWAFRTAHVVFFLIVHPSHENILGKLASAAARRWDPRFVSGTPLETEDPTAN